MRIASRAGELHVEQPVAIAHGTHRPQLDALRCFAVTGVLIAHFCQPALSGIAAAIDPGFLGVRLFFVLSGFLITGILLDARDAATASGAARVGVLGRFYARRVLRIFPLYYAIVLGGLLLDVPRAREAAPWLLAYASNFYELVTQRSVGHYGHFWTLAVEEQFYMIWPWLVLFAPRPRLGWLMLAAVASAVIYRDLVHDVLLTQNGWAQMTIGSLDTLGVGALLALAFRDGHSAEWLQRMLRTVVLPVGLAGFLALHWHASATGQLRLLIAGQELSFALVCCWLIAGAYRGFGGPAARLLTARNARLPRAHQLRHLRLPHAGSVVPDADLSHVRRHAAAARPRAPADRGGVTVAIAAASWRYFEAPINSLKRGVPYDRN